jgi:hypothetical protein
MKKPVVPSNIMTEIGLKEPAQIRKTAPLIQDTKHTKQFSIKFPLGVIEETGWIAGNKIEFEIKSDGLMLRKINA